LPGYIGLRASRAGENHYTGGAELCSHRFEPADPFTQ